MKLKANALTLILVSCLLFLASCQSATNVESPIIYNSDNVKVSLMENTNNVNYAYYEWTTLTDDIAYTKNTVIITGKASNIRPVTVSYTYMNADVTDNITIFDIEIYDVLSCRSGSFSQGDIITIGVGYNMDVYGEGLPIIEEGTSYMIFCYVAKDKENDVLELSEYVDCWISAPKDLFLEKIGDFYLSIDYFSDMPNSINLQTYLNLTEDQINSLSAIGNKNINTANAYIDEEIILDSASKNVENAAEALLTLKTRTKVDSKELWNLTSRAYLINCNDLENYVRNKALEYDN
ncbi:MAG: hypothetical protein E7671_03535 [Ruminococcaceae bacterium]|nr:hypothetical protein [Oscillospiraceae bacterium]